ncbi:Nicotinamide/nicotinic acid mononucleotide adenylyltransferase 1 [Trichoplax sp. H2]|nr:Nicotinamide/nicotinic acid mononucleotide adenylyltransferase 1 [Trichoplax sp. H2]|eukprot:RDD40565.1 Nicotinamide/nicotinic acid mononucleotide adenylyltransferase 1 [Trichoplax sp. H2]
MASKSPLILLACGSFNPITHMHLRLFENARDAMNATGYYNVKAGIVSPVHDSYKKEGLISSKHRLEMCNIALQTSDWIRCNDWECRRSEWSRTVEVLRYIKSISHQLVGHGEDDKEASIFIFSIYIATERCQDVGVKLLCGADLLESFATPNLWSTDDLQEIVEKFGLVCITRHGSDPRKFIYLSDLLWKYEVREMNEYLRSNHVSVILIIVQIKK